MLGEAGFCGVLPRFQLLIRIRVNCVRLAGIPHLEHNLFDFLKCEKTLRPNFIPLGEQGRHRASLHEAGKGYHSLDANSR